MLEEDRRCA